MNKYGEKINELYHIFTQLEKYFSKFDGVPLPYMVPYYISNTMDLIDYNHLPEIIEMYNFVTENFPSVKSVTCETKRDEEGKLIKEQVGDYEFKGYLDKISSADIDDYLCSRSKYDVTINGVTEKEFIIHKNISSATEPAILSTSGKALFKLFDNTSLTYRYFDSDYLDEIMELGINKPFYEWEDGDFMMLKLSLPNPDKR